MDEHVIVVGGGIGGLCSGIYLSNKGFQVTIVEKNETLGGKARHKKHNCYGTKRSCR